MGQRRLFRSCFSKEAILRVEEKERHLIKMARFTNFLLLTVCSPLILGKPQYGGAPVQTPVSPQLFRRPPKFPASPHRRRSGTPLHRDRVQQSAKDRLRVSVGGRRLRGQEVGRGA